MRIDGRAAVAGDKQQLVTALRVEGKAVELEMLLACDDLACRAANDRGHTLIDTAGLDADGNLEIYADDGVVVVQEADEDE